MTFEFARAGGRVLMAGLLLCAVAPLATAQEWSGKGEAGIALASGNTDSKTARAKVAVNRKAESWETMLGLAGLYVRNSGETTARRWEVSSQARYNVSPKTFVFGAGRYEEDKFSGFDYQAVINTGLGHKFLDSDTTKLSSQVGVGFKFLEAIPGADPADEHDGTMVGVAGVDFSHKLTDTTTVFNRFELEYTDDNTFLQNEVGVTVKVSDRMALSLAYAVRRNSNPPDTFRKTDTLSTVSLVYEVK